MWVLRRVNMMLYPAAESGHSATALVSAVPCVSALLLQQNTALCVAHELLIMQL